MRVRRCHSSLALLLGTLLASGSATAHAQAWLANRDSEEGTGLRVGNLELHPGLGAELGYLSNVFNADTNEQATVGWRVAPHLMFQTLGEKRRSEGADDADDARPGMIDFRGGISASLLDYLETAGFMFGTNGELKLTIAPERPVGFQITENFSRNAQPFSEAGPQAGGKSGGDFARDQEAVGGKLILTTPGGLLKGGLGYRFSYDWFEAAPYDTNDATAHRVSLDGNWEFLPKTAVFYEGAFTHQNYTQNDAKDQPALCSAAGSSTTASVLCDNDIITTRMGLNGAITALFSATIGAGYTVGFSDDDNDYEGINAQAELRYVPSKTTEIGLGYDRTLSSAYQGGNQTRDRVQLRGRAMFGGVAMLSGKVGVEFVDYGRDRIQQALAQDQGVASNGDRSDRVYFADLAAEYRFVSWLAMTAQAGITIDDTDFKFLPAMDAFDNGATADAAKYTAFEAWLGMRAFF